MVKGTRACEVESFILANPDSRIEKRMKRLLLLGLFLLLAVFAVSAHEGEEAVVDSESIKVNSILYVSIASAITFIALICALGCKKQPEALKWILFLAMVIPVLVATFYVAGSTIYLNVKSETAGPVHWHADFEIWNCGEKLDLNDPTGALNRVGSPVFHEHGDDRIHMEGVVVRKTDVDLHEFFEKVGGSLTGDSFSWRTNNGVVEANNGELCNGKAGKVQIFVLKVTNPYADRTEFVYEQFKADENYVLSPQAIVPPGDCIILEFDEEKATTDKICETFRIAKEKGDLSGS